MPFKHGSSGKLCREIRRSFRSVVVITFASHAKGPQFEPGRKQTFFLFPLQMHNLTPSRTYHYVNLNNIIAPQNVLVAGNLKQKQRA